MEFNQGSISNLEHSHETSLMDLPTELRLEICRHLLKVANIPPSYGYTGPIEPDSSEDLKSEIPPFTTKRQRYLHGMLLVNKHLSYEYRQTFYEHTNFFLRIDSTNAFKTIPDLSRDCEYSASFSSLPNFWNAPPVLLSSLRHCTLFIELGEIGLHESSTHSLSNITRPAMPITEAPEVRAKLTSSSSLAEMCEQDAHFDSSLRAAILTLLSRMTQLQTIQLVWDLSPPVVLAPAGLNMPRRRFRAMQNTSGWGWDSFGEMFVAVLKGKGTLTRASVKVGDSLMDALWEGEKVEGKWEERVQMPDGPFFSRKRR